MPPTVHTPRRRSRRRTLALAFCAAASWAAAAGPVDPRDGAALITACFACHGRDGVSESAEIPNLAGQKKRYLVRQLQAFKSGERKNDLMSAVAAQLGDADIEALAALWSQWPAPNAGPAAVAAIASRMNFPADFPHGFTLYQTAGDAEGHVVKRYANGVALQAAREQKPLPSGAVIVVATHAAQRDAAHRPVHDAQGDVVAAEPLSYAGMEAGAGWGRDVPALLRNGDWDYALFGADRVRRTGVNQAACLACHKPMAASSYLFTMTPLLVFASMR
jgi:cytochrome c553